MNQCVYLKQKLDRTIYCKKDKRIITFVDCKNCDSKNIELNKTRNTLNKISKSLTERQNKRFSIINHDLTKCAICGLKNGVQLNEVFEGAKRGVSMKHGFVIPLCDKHHKQFHNDRAFAIPYKQVYQREFEKTHTHEEFMNLIHRNYL